MLSDAEHQRLSEIETSFRATDPAFVRQFDRPRHHKQARRTGALLALIIAAIVTVLALVAGTMAVAVPAAYVVLYWMRRPETDDEIGYVASKACCDPDW